MLGEVLTAIVTPFDAEGAVAIDRFRALCRHLVDHGSDGVVVTGTTGEVVEDMDLCVRSFQQMMR